MIANAEALKTELAKCSVMINEIRADPSLAEPILLALQKKAVAVCAICSSLQVQLRVYVNSWCLSTPALQRSWTPALQRPSAFAISAVGICKQLHCAGLNSEADFEKPARCPIR